MRTIMIRGRVIGDCFHNDIWCDGMVRFVVVEDHPEYWVETPLCEVHQLAAFREAFWDEEQEAMREAAYELETA